MMRKTIFFLCASLLIRSTLLAQELNKVDSVNKNIHPSRLSIGIFYNPSVNTYCVYGDTNYGNSAIVKSHTGYNYGAICNYRMTSRLSIQSGVGVSDFGYDMQYSGVYYPHGLYRYTIGYIEVPLEAKVVITSPYKRMKLIGSLGGFVAFLTKSKGGSPIYVSGTTKLDLSHFDDFDKYAPILGGLNIGGGVSYSYTDKITLEFQPFIKIIFNKNTYSYDSWDNEWTHISSIGFRISVNYKL